MMDYVDGKLRVDLDRMPHVQVRRFEEADLEGAYQTIQLALEIDALTKVYEPGQLEVWHDWYSPKYILGLSKLQHLYVAVYEDQIVGTAAVQRIDSEAYVNCVYVNPNYQGLGIGKSLMEALEKDEISRETGKMVLLASMTTMKFYKKLGFHYEGESPEITVNDGVEFVNLVKEL